MRDNLTKLSDEAAQLLADPKRTANQMSELSRRIEQAAALAEQDAASAREKALNPRLLVAEAAKLRKDREDAEWLAERLLNAKEQLAVEVEALEDQEKEADRLTRYEDAKRQSYDLAARIKAEYPALLQQLMQLIADIQSVTREVVLVNKDLPKGHEMLQGPEGLARGFNDCAGTQHRIKVARIVNSMLVPFIPHSNYAWPVADRQTISAAQAGGFSPYNQWPTKADVDQALALVAQTEAPRLPTIDDPAGGVVKADNETGGQSQD